jgi:hypothetical protein
VAAADDILSALRQLLLHADETPSERDTFISGATASEFAQLRFGGPTRVSITIRSIGTVASRLLDNNPRRVGWVAANRGTSDGAFSTDPGVLITTGLPIQAAGGAVSMQVDEDGEAVAWEWYAVTGAAAQSCVVFEFIRV